MTSQASKSGFGADKTLVCYCDSLGGCVGEHFGNWSNGCYYVPKKAPIVQLTDGRTFPVYNGEALSWDISTYMTTNEERAGYPRAKAVIAAMVDHRPEQLERERRNALRGSFNRVFGRNAERLLKLIDHWKRATEPAR